MRICIGSDHRGYKLKKYIINAFKDIEWMDVGTDSSEKRVDYPVYAKEVCDLILSETFELGILICASGVGMSIAANRFPKIYAALCWSSEVAQSSREDDNSNILVLPADYISESEALGIIEAWIHAKFKDGHYQKRLDMIDS